MEIGQCSCEFCDLCLITSYQFLSILFDICQPAKIPLFRGLKKNSADANLSIRRKHNLTKMLKLKEVKGATGLSRSSIYNLISKGIFPQQVRLCPSGRAVGWLCAEVEDYLAQRVASRQDADSTPQRSENNNSADAR